YVHHHQLHTIPTRRSSDLEFSVYPNPSTGIFNINTSEMVNIKVVDITGKVVYQAQNVDNNGVVNLSSLQKGVYLMQVSGDTIQKDRKSTRLNSSHVKSSYA